MKAQDPAVPARAVPRGPRGVARRLAARASTTPAVATRAGRPTQAAQAKWAAVELGAAAVAVAAGALRAPKVPPVTLAMGVMLAVVQRLEARAAQPQPEEARKRRAARTPPEARKRRAARTPPEARKRRAAPVPAAVRTLGARTLAGLVPAARILVGPVLAELQRRHRARR
jgi:hypothetical protein